MKILALALFLTFFAACSPSAPTTDELVKASAEAKLKEAMNDPASYEFVSLKRIDSTYYRDNVKYRNEYFNDRVETAKKDIARQEDYSKEYASMGVPPPDHCSPEKIAQLKDELERLKETRSEVKALGDGIGDKADELASYTYTFKFRGNNAMGAKILTEYFVQTGPAPSFEIINMTAEEGKLFNNPGDYPGYRDMIAKHIGN